MCPRFQKDRANVMNVAESKRVTAPEAAQNWLARFAEALQSQDAHAAADMFLADGLWRDVLAFTWTIETMSGRAAIKAALSQTLARTKPANFHIPPKRTAPRRVSRAGIELDRGHFRIRDRVRPRARHCAPGARPADAVTLARLDAAHGFAGIARP